MTELIGNVKGECGERSQGASIGSRGRTKRINTQGGGEEKKGKKKGFRTD